MLEHFTWIGPARRQSDWHWLVLLCLMRSSPVSAGSLTSAEFLGTPTDGTSPQPFLKNPAALQVESALVGGAVFLRNAGSVKAEETEEGGDSQTFETEISEDLWGVGLHSDIGAGTAVGIIYERLFRNLQQTTSDDDEVNLLEQLATQYVGLQLIVDLTDDLVMGLVVRNLHEEAMIVGNYDLPQQEATRFKTTMFGYGLGGIYRFPKGSFGVASLPPLRGKTDIFGEEKIVATPGELEFSADYAPTKEHRFGLQYATLQYKRDDLAEGTTIDNDSNAPISLTGLSYDRFLFPYRRIGLGYDHTFSSQMTGIFALYREESEFLFDPDSEPGDSDELLTMNSYTLKLNLKYTSGDLTFVGGLNFNEAETEFDRSDTAVTYESSTRTLHMVLEKSL